MDRGSSKWKPFNTVQNTWLFRPSHNPLRSFAQWRVRRRLGTRPILQSAEARSCWDEIKVADQSVLCYNLTDKQSSLLLHWVKYLRNLMSVQNRSDLRHIMSQGSAWMLLIRFVSMDGKLWSHLVCWNNDQSVAEVFHFYGFYPVINFNESKI